MFHLLIGLTAMGLAAAALAVIVIPLWLGPLAQFLVSLLSRGRTAKWVPAALGALGLGSGLYESIWKKSGFPVRYVLLYWGIYALLLWAFHTLGIRLGNWLRGRKKPAPEAKEE